jgi:hypothetical protein|tara:strand:+ start:255 stop:431 length:177 start_codon:yes stop_codon:yes gene_type:complete
LLWCGISGDIKIFWFKPQKNIADAAANQIGFKTTVVQAVKNLYCIFTDIVAGYWMFVP